MSGPSTATAPAEARPIRLRTTTGGRRRPRPPTRDSGWWALLFLLPAAAGLVIFEIWPTFQTIYFSFTSWGPSAGTCGPGWRTTGR